MPTFPSPVLYEEYLKFLYCRPILYGTTPPTFEQWLKCEPAIVGPQGPMGPTGPAGPQGPVGPAGQSTYPAALALGGMLFTASTDRVVVNAGQALMIVLQNPAASGIVTQVIALKDTPETSGTYLERVVGSPSTGTLTPATSYNTNIGNAGTPSTVALIGTVDVTYPAAPGVLLASEWDLADYLRGAWVIQPGSELGFALQYADENGEGNVSIMWAELPIVM